MGSTGTLILISLRHSVSSELFSLDFPKMKTLFTVPYIFGNLHSCYSATQCNSLARSL